MRAGSVAAVNRIDYVVELLRRQPWLTAREIDAQLGLPAGSTHTTLARWASGPYARLRRVHGGYRYALFQEPTPPPAND